MDRLSYLPHPIRSQIISFLPTRHAMRLAILSSHWRDISLSLPKLVFVRNRNENPETFRDCIDRTLASHDETDIQVFNLKEASDRFITETDLDRWITLVLRHNVQKLWLFLWTRKPTCLPSSLFTCPTLEFLNLSNIRLELFPSFISFPKLKLFALCNVQIGDAVRKSFSMSFPETSFPVLEGLKLLTRQQITSLSISTPSFKELQLEYFNSPGLKLSISTQQQLNFCYQGRPLDIGTIDITSETFSLIHTATFDVLLDHQTSSTAMDATKILSALWYTETLDLSIFFIENLSWDQTFSSQSLTLSPNLKKLDLMMSRAKKNHVKIVKFLTQSFSRLQTLNISFEDIPEGIKGLQKTELPVADDIVMIRHLREIELVNFKGTENELELARHLLATATMLEEMSVSFSVDTDVDTQKRIELNLMSSPKVSQLAVRLVYRKEALTNGSKFCNIYSLRK